MRDKFKKLERTKGYKIIKSILKAILSFLVVVFLLIQKNYGMERTQTNCYAAGFTIVGYMAITTVEETAVAQPVLACLGLLMGIVLYKINRKNNSRIK